MPSSTVAPANGSSGTSVALRITSSRRPDSLAAFLVLTAVFIVGAEASPGFETDSTGHKDCSYSDEEA